MQFKCIGDSAFISESKCPVCEGQDTNKIRNLKSLLSLNLYTYPNSDDYEFEYENALTKAYSENIFPNFTRVKNITHSLQLDSSAENVLKNIHSKKFVL